MSIKKVVKWTILTIAAFCGGLIGAALAVSAELSRREEYPG